MRLIDVAARMIFVAWHCSGRWRACSVALLLVLPLGAHYAYAAIPATKGEDAESASSDEMPDDACAPAKSKPNAKPKAAKSDKASNAEQKSAAKEGAALKYAFKEGERYVYEVEIAADFGDSVKTISGRSTYTVKSADEDQIVLDHEGRLVAHDQSRGGQSRFRDPRHRGAFNNFPATFGGPGQVTIDTSGNVIKNTSQAQLPFLLGSLATLVLEPFSPEGKSTWEVSNDLAVGSAPKKATKAPGRSRADECSRRAGAPGAQFRARSNGAGDIHPRPRQGRFGEDQKASRS